MHWPFMYDWKNIFSEATIVKGVSELSDLCKKDQNYWNSPRLF